MVSSESKTVRVRIAVVVASDGEWNSCGWSGAESDGEMVGIVLDCLGEDGQIRWVEADIPLPSEPTVIGEVVDGEGDE